MSVFSGSLRSGVRLLVLLAAVVIGATPSQAAVLTFEDVPLGPDGAANVFGFYGDPASTFFVLGDFQAHGPGAASTLTPETSSGSGAISTSLASFGSLTTTLVDSSASPFTLVSIDLARQASFSEPANGVSYPRVTFTGTKTGGGTVSQTFLVDQADFFFRTFSFSSDFTDLVSVAWVQPASGAGDPDAPGRLLGLHQFDNVRVEAVTAAVPEPAALSLLGLGSAMAAFRVRRARKTRRDGSSTSPC